MTNLFKRKNRLKELKRSNFSDVRPDDIKIDLSFFSDRIYHNQKNNYIAKLKTQLRKIFQKNIRPNLIHIAKKLCTVNFNIQICITSYSDKNDYFSLNYYLLDNSKNIVGDLSLLKNIDSYWSPTIVFEKADPRYKHSKYPFWHEYLKSLKHITSEDILLMIYKEIQNSEYDNYIRTKFKQNTKIEPIYESVLNVLKTLKKNNILHIPYAKGHNKNIINIFFIIGTQTHYSFRIKKLDSQINQNKKALLLKDSQINYKDIMSFIFNDGILDHNIESDIKHLDKDSYFECLKLLTY